MAEWILNYWIEVLFGIIIACWTVAYKRLCKKIKEQECVKLGVQALLRDRIVQSYNHYLEKDYCPIYARENVDELYEQYHALGGNGTVTGLVEKLKELPTVPKKQKEEN